MGRAPTVLMLEDNEDTVFLISRLLEKHCELSVCKSIENAKLALAHGSFDLMLLDLELPDGGGLGFYAQVKQDDVHCNTPAIFITGNGALDQKLEAFGLGADDYITKPFDPSEMKARVLSKLAKVTNNVEMDRIITVKNLAVNLATQRVTLNSNGRAKPVYLSQIEFRLLTMFLKQIDRVFSREQLIDHVWTNDVHISLRTLDSHVSHLRTKLRGAACAIDSVRGVGYRMIVLEKI